MKRLAATALALGAVTAFAIPAFAAATTNLGLWSNQQPVTVKVDGKPVVVNSLYDSTWVKVTVGSKVKLEPPQTFNGLEFCGWSGEGITTRVRTVTIHGDWRDHYSTDYARAGQC